MKKIFLKTSFYLFTISATLVACNSKEEEVTEAQEKVNDANNALTKANKDYIKDMENFTNTSKEKIADNEQVYSEFELILANEKKLAKTDYLSKISEIKQRNVELKKRLEDYKGEGKENWEKFKTEFDKEMEDLNTAFKNLTKDNLK